MKTTGEIIDNLKEAIDRLQEQEKIIAGIKVKNAKLFETKVSFEAKCERQELKIEELEKKASLSDALESRLQEKNQKNVELWEIIQENNSKILKIEIEMAKLKEAAMDDHATLSKINYELENENSKLVAERNDLLHMIDEFVIHSTADWGCPLLLERAKFELKRARKGNN